MSKDLENKIEELTEEELDNVAGGLTASNLVYNATSKPIVTNAIYKETLSGGKTKKDTTATKKTPGSGNGSKLMMC